ncbi:MAG: hypothetical protein CSA65_05075 [Proteobacteria bacterium]|nr:MAG: hypothetical protein CSA65_05075 [Pseudomonadota bacterium]
MSEDKASVPELTEGQVAKLATASEVLDLLIRLHDREVDAAFLQGMRDHDLAGWLSGVLVSQHGQDAAAALCEALAVDADMDLLAAEYADLYLTHGYRVSPSGSVWMTEDHLERQLPMFDVREWYDHYDVTVPNWRVRADDHLVHELQFVSFLCAHGNGVAAADAANFLDQHVLPWLPEFCRQAAKRVEQPLYAALMALTLAVLDELRDMLAEITGIARNVRVAAPPKAHREADEEDVAYMPGLAESW